MKKDTKIYLAIILIVILVIIGIYALKNKDTADIRLAKCIGEEAEFYGKLGCPACDKQEELFGENVQYLNKIDCFYQGDKCIEKEITAYPTWIIDGEKYIGVRSLESLQELAEC